MRKNAYIQQEQQNRPPKQPEPNLGSSGVVPRHKRVAQSTLNATSHIGSMAGQAALTPIGAKMILFFTVAILFTILSMVYTPSSHWFLDVAIGFLVSVFIFALTSSLFPKKKASQPKEKKVDLSKLTDKQREEFEFLQHKATKGK